MSHSLRRSLSRTLFVLGLVFASQSALAAQNLEVHVLDVDQGLSVFVRSPTGMRVLIDAGNPGDGTALVKPYLQSIGVTQLDSSFMTHWHTDHFGGMAELFNAGYKPLSAAYDRGDVNKPSNSFVTSYLGAVTGKRQFATLGQTLAIGGGATIQVMAVNGAWSGGSVDPTTSSQEENSRSLALVIRYGDFDCYVGGDCTANGDGSTSNVEGPATAVIGQVEVAVASHHGSSTGSTTQVVANLAPAMVIESAGLDNPYGHPTNTVVNRWNTTAAARVQWCTTDGDTTNGAGSFTGVNGGIVITSDGSTFQAKRAGALQSLTQATWELPTTLAGVSSLVLGEALVDPVAASDAFGEWFEIQSVAPAAVSLAGLKVSSGANAFTIASPILLAPGERFLVGVDGRTSRNGNVFVGLGAPWGLFALANTTSSLSLRTASNALIETLSWGAGGVTLAPGKSAERILPNQPSAPSNFATALTAWTAGGDLGTPGAVNANDPASCPAPFQFGVGKLNSVGLVPTAGSTGTPSVFTNDFALTVSGAVPNKPALGLYSNAQGSLPFYGGTLYVGAPIHRTVGQTIGAGGGASWPFPLTATDAGKIYYFQIWYRDTNAPDGTHVGLSNALQAQICPSSVPPPPPPPVTGTIIVSEIMKDPTVVADSQGEWFEVYNTTAQAIDIEGWTIRDDGTDAHVIANGGAGVVVPAGQFKVLGINGNTGSNGGIAVFYTYSGVFLGNSGDEVVLVDDTGLEIDRVAYLAGGGWPGTPGRALNLHGGRLDGVSNDSPLNWCNATTTIGGGNNDMGTPGAANTICP
ncbi:MAG TPA: lamin tail domain-containing protein [Planctomycetota bacterium]|nr:lamin tail domain-containing protein [Planctomycetota bacterium]